MKERALHQQTPLTPHPQCEVLLEIYLDNDVYIHFALSHGEKGKVGDGVFMRSEAAREVMRRLRSMGVKINNIQIQ
jgi:hypothetical protein